MKSNTRINYYRPIEFIKLPKDKQEQYKKDKHALRKNMRALVAYQDSSDAIDGGTKKTMNAVFDRYRLSHDRSYAVTEVMRAFWGDDRYENEIIPIYARKNAYDEASASDKKYIEKTYAPVDYMSIETLYHYYKFRQTIIKLDSKQKFTSFDSLLVTAKKEYFGTPNRNNLYFTNNDLKLEKEPVASYVNIMSQQRKRVADATKCTENSLEVANLPVPDLIKADVINYMLSYVDETKKSLNESTRHSLREWYTVTSTTGIMKRGYSEDCNKVLIPAYTFADNCDFSKYNLSKTKEKENFNHQIETPKKMIEKATISIDKVSEDNWDRIKEGTQFTLPGMDKE